MELLVREFKRKDECRGIVGVPDAVIAGSPFSEGDYVTVSGDRGTAVGRIWSGYPNDDGEDVIRLDEQYRRRVGAEPGDAVSIREQDVTVAESVTVEVRERSEVGRVESQVETALQRWAVEADQELVLPGRGKPLGPAADSRIVARVTDVAPAGTALVTEETDVRVTGDTKPLDPPAGPEVRPADELPGSRQERTRRRRVDVEDDADGSVPDVTFDDVGGLDDEISRMRVLVGTTLQRPELYDRLGIEPSTGVLLYGPPGTGKTILSRAVANHVDASLQVVSAPEILSEYYGESEQRLRETFEEAKENAPAVVLVDEIDAIAGKRGQASGDVEQRIVAQLLTLMDDLGVEDRVSVVATTNRVDHLDGALRRGGRFGQEIEIGVPERAERREILEIHTQGMPLADDVSLDDLVERTHGYVGADIDSLVNEAGLNAIRRVRDLDGTEPVTLPVDDVADLTITGADVEAAFEETVPSAIREFAAELPETTWDDVGGLDDAVQQLRESIQWPIAYADAFERMDLDRAVGVLLYGPPGTGKTLLARAAANEADANFIPIDGPELLNRYVGDSERAIRQVFERARRTAPTVLFFDELDAIAASRDGDGDGGGATDRVVTQLLTEMDGIEGNDDVIAVATTNRPDIVDPALCRAGRFERKVRVGVPDEDARERIFEVHLADRSLAGPVDVAELAAETEGYVGADIEAICREMAMAALRRSVPDRDADATFADLEITPAEVEAAMDAVSPSVTEEQRERYEGVMDRFETEPEETAVPEDPTFQ